MIAVNRAARPFLLGNFLPGYHLVNSKTSIKFVNIVKFFGIF